MKSIPTVAGSRALVPFSLLTVVLLAMLVLIPLELATDSLRKEATDRVATASAISADSIAQKMDALGRTVETFADRSRIRPGPDGSAVEDPASPVRTELRELQRSSPDIRSAFTLTADGKIAAVEPWTSPNIGADYSFRSYYKGAVASEGPYVSEVFLGNVAARRLVTVSSAIRDDSDGPTEPSKTVSGVVVVSVDVASVFQAYVEEFERTRGITMAIYDQLGNVVARPGIQPEIVNARDARVDAANRGEPWSGQRESNGESVLVAYQPVATTGWSVSASVATDAAFASVERLRSGVRLIALLVGTVLVGVLVWLLRLLRARDRARARIEAGEERTREIVETAAQAYCEIDASGRLTVWNKQAERVFGWTADEAVGQLIIDTIVVPERRETAMETLGQLFDDSADTPNRVYFETSAHCKNGDVLSVEVTMWVTAFEDEKIVSAFIHDISERKRLEQEQDLIVRRQRRLVEELRQADKVKSDFISTISHELRTPLTSIVGYIEMLRDGFGGTLAAQQQSMLEVVDRNSRRLLGLIDDVLTLSRIESGVFKVSSTRVDVLSLIASAQQALYPSIIERQLDFEVDVETDTSYVQGDVNQLERVLMNLLSNAVKFTPDGGKIGVRARRFGSTVRIAVYDTGIGIPADEQHRLFNRFFRASSAQDHAIQGTGLGLTIVKSIVERHGGTVSVESVVDEGTTFTIELPVVDADSPLTTSP